MDVRPNHPAATIAHFEAPHMKRTGEEWASEDYENAKCRVHLTFGSDIPKIDVQWE